mgnify:CR=1 FL=1|jgi:hypothetical protein|uniref:Uncharacterized protein n=1 Tax=viral metagenome TaxID=1070528 RepID=A0A6C0CY51_9ZZZZ
MMESKQENNLKYEIKENTNNKQMNDVDSILNNENFFQDKDFQEEFQFFDEDNIMAQHIDYFENYTVKMLQHIANYYKIPKAKLKKEELIQLIIQFENQDENSEEVYNRKRMWHYITELKNDSYFSKFILFLN